MPHICLITDAYPPEVRSASVLMRELAEQLSARGHRVTVLTTLPEYNLAAGDHKKHAGRTREGDIDVVRVRSFFLHNVGLVRKALGQLWLPTPVIQAGGAAGPFDAVIVYTPPLPLAWAGWSISRRFGARLLLNVQDLFPQNAIDLGALKNPAAIGFFRWLERLAYERADRIVVHSGGNARWLSERGYGRKVKVIPNWFDFSPIERDPERRALAALGLPSRFTVFFGGVMGYAQDLDVIVEAAAALREEPEIQFLLVGDGVDRHRAETEARRRSCTNVFFRNFVDPAAYRGLLGCVDVGLLTLRGSMKTPVVPNKLLGFFAAQLPVAAALHAESDARRLIEEAGAGINVPAGDGRLLAAAIRALFRAPVMAAQCGRRAREYGLNQFGVARAADQYLSLLPSRAARADYVLARAVSR